MDYCLKFDRNKNIRDLPGDIMIKLRQVLDSRSADSTSFWRLFAALLRGQFVLNAMEVEHIAGRIYSGASPAEQLLLDVGAKGMTVEQLVPVLNELKIEEILCDLVETEKVTILQQPDSCVKVKEGEQIVLMVEAHGFPYPRYLWYYGQKSIKNATDSVLIINKARPEDSGDYCCLVYNNSLEGAFSNWSTVTVVPSIKKDQPLISEEKVLTDKPGHVYTLPFIVKHPQSLEVSLNNSFCLVCEAKGHLPLTYLWTRNEKPVYDSPTGFLQVNHVTPHDYGVYQCHVRNKFGTVKSNYVEVSRPSLWPVFDPAPLIPEITEHPKSVHVEVGGHALFRCGAHGSGFLSYQWFKDSDSIPGANECEYRVDSVKDRGAEGVYMCLVTNEHGHHSLSKGAVLQIGDIPIKRDYFATDKLALLIGNYDYRTQQPLNAPQRDIQNLSHIFQQILGFKVVSLLNLTLVEMYSAVAEFCELIDSGVYAVFYFGGHGFEENNQCFLLPNDVPTDYKMEECLPADMVLNEIQQRRPRICCMILDICRKPSENSCQGQQTAFKQRTPVEDGNTIICYATSPGLAAYESRPHNQGILVTHLEKLLPQPLCIEEVFRRVKEAVGNDNRIRNGCDTKQIPEVRSNLIEVQRSFRDPLLTTGHTQACTRRQLAWEHAHVKPPEKEVLLNPTHLGVRVRLTFQHEFSNVLGVFITVIEQGNLPHCVVWIRSLPSSVSLMRKPSQVNRGAETSVTKQTLIDIQKLKQNLRVGLAMQYKLPGSHPNEPYLTSEYTEVDLQFPLVANLRLWQRRQLQPSIRTAVEQAEDDHSQPGP